MCGPELERQGSLSDVMTRKRRNVIGIDMIRNNRITYLRCYCYHWIDTSAGGLLFISLRGCHPPSSKCFGTDMVYEIHSS